MANITITNVSPFGIVIFNPVFQNDTLNVSGAVTYAEGTLLARREVATTITPTPDGGNTGDGTVTAATVVTGSVVPLVGNYVLTCIEAVANGGIFKLEDPNGSLVAGYLQMTVGAGASTVFVAGGMTFTITDGAADFVAGDFFTLAVAADGDMVAYSRTGVGGEQNPIAVLVNEEVLTGAGDTSIRPMISGQVRKGDLIIHGVGAINETEVTALRDYGILALDVTQLAEFDNA